MWTSAFPFCEDECISGLHRDGQQRQLGLECPVSKEFPIHMDTAHSVASTDLKVLDDPKDELH